MSTDTPSESITALLAYSQADEEGIIVTVSRQAIHEVVRENARLREEVEMLNVRHAAAMLHAQTHADEYNALREDVNGLLQDIQRLTEEAFKRDEELAQAKRGSDRLLSAMLAEEEKLRPLIEKAGCDPQHHGADIAIKELLIRAEQAESRTLAAENKVAWQEVETADLRDDVKRLHKTVSECEERALENQKDAGRYRWLRDSKNAYPLFFIAQRDPHNIVVQFSGELADMNIDAAVAGAKHD